MVDPIIIDLVFLAVLIAAFFVGRARGIIKMLWGLLAWVVTVILALTLAAPFAAMIGSSSAANSAKEAIEQKTREKLTGALQNGGSTAADIYAGIPEIFIPKDAPAPNGLNTEEAQRYVSEISERISENAVRIIFGAVSFILLILLIRFAMMLIFRILNIASKLPVINAANRLFGSLLGIAGSLIIIYMLLAYISLFVAGDMGLIIGQTYIVKYFYNNNILLLLCGR